uniref:Protein DGCR6L n=1 Tax=Ornithorhynchus anatinus TaxID=9258 RepID=A0A6I8PCD1_ORNAN
MERSSSSSLCGFGAEEGPAGGARQQERHYRLLSALQGLVNELPSSCQQRLSYTMLSDLALALLDGTVFEIVQGLLEIQHLTERSLYSQRLKLQSEHRGERGAPGPRGQGQVAQPQGPGGGVALSTLFLGWWFQNPSAPIQVPALVRQASADGTMGGGDAEDLLSRPHHPPVLPPLCHPDFPTGPAVEHSGPTVLGVRGFGPEEEMETRCPVSSVGFGLWPAPVTVGDISCWLSRAPCQLLPPLLPLRARARPPPQPSLSNLLP